MKMPSNTENLFTITVVNNILAYMPKLEDKNDHKQVVDHAVRIMAYTMYADHCIHGVWHREEWSLEEFEEAMLEEINGYFGFMPRITARELYEELTEIREKHHKEAVKDSLESQEDWYKFGYTYGAPYEIKSYLEVRN